MEPLRVGIVGIGNISGIYLKNLSAFRSTEVVAVADLDLSRAEKAASEYGVPNVLTVDGLLAHPDVELVLNLTIPKAHGPVALQAVKAGKHVYNEKPLCVDPEEGAELLAAAKANNVLVGCAPDTFMGAGLQTCRAAIDSGEIGQPVAGQAFMLGRGPEPWHPSPDFFYLPGGGPMLDMGPYYITALVHLLGGIKRLTGITRISYPERPIPLSNEGYYKGAGLEFAEKGRAIKVETPTHLTGIMEFASGPVVEIATSFDVYHAWKNHPITIFGSEGTMMVPDPNGFGGDVMVRRHDEEEWRTLPLKHGFAENSRGVGVLDMAYAARTGSAHRASGKLAYHVLDAMTSFQKSSESGRHIELASIVDRPAAMAVDQYAGDVPAATPAG